MKKSHCGYNRHVKQQNCAIKNEITSFHYQTLNLHHYSRIIAHQISFIANILKVRRSKFICERHQNSNLNYNHADNPHNKIPYLSINLGHVFLSQITLSCQINLSPLTCMWVTLCGAC